jgi:hypothetical protein
MNNYILICPFAYGIKTRTKTWVSKLSFVGLFVIPNILFCYFSSEGEITIINFFVALSTLFSAYEVGYIYNDVLAVKYETNPTKWIPVDSLEFVHKTYEILIGIRVIWIVIACWILSVSYSISKVFTFLLVLGFLNLFYGIHNYIRGVGNCITFFLLQFIKYGGLVILFGKGRNILTYIVCGVLEIGIVRTYEYLRDKRYLNSMPLIENVDLRRVLYCLLLTMITLVVSNLINDYGILLTCIYMLIYRLFCFWLSKIDFIKDDRKKIRR